MQNNNHNQKQNKNRTAKSSGRHQYRQRNDYIDSFHWGFVENHNSSEESPRFPDDDPFLGDLDGGDDVATDVGALLKKDSGQTSGRAQKQPNDKKSGKEKTFDRNDKKPAVTKTKTDEAKKKGTNDKNHRKKGGGADALPSSPSKSLVVNDLSFDDDDDLHLPSYGRTHVLADAPASDAGSPKRQEPKPVQKQQARTAERHSTGAPVKHVAGPPPEHKEPSGKAVPKKQEMAPPKHVVPMVAPPKPPHTSAIHPKEEPHRRKKEPMVWDPDKREYVPLVIPERLRTKPVSKEQASPSPTSKPAPTKTPAPVQKDHPKTDSRPSSSPPVKEPSPKKSHSEQMSAKREPMVPKKGHPDRDKEAKKSIDTGKAAEKPPERQSPQPSEQQHHPKHKDDIEKPKPREQRREPKENQPQEHRRSSIPRGAVPKYIEPKRPDPADGELEPTGFVALGVSEVMLKTLKSIRYLEPTPIQAGVFKQVQAGKDVLGQAQTGTGKTAAFLIPIIEQVEECEPGDNPIALILVPTRELAVQVRDEAHRLSYGREIRTSACYGGKPLAKQIARLRDGVDILVGTPGRILDLINRRALSLDNLRWVILDEADRMLDIGFRPDIEKILRRTPQTRQTLLFSATLPPPVVRLAERYMKSPENLDFSAKNIAVETIEQFYVTVDQERKFDALVFLLNEQKPNQAIIFTRTKRGADRLARLLSNHFESLETIHGDLSQPERDRVMSQFRASKIRYLVATDVVGRGIDVTGISHIINYDIPKFCDDYVHRVGRTGRMGREGVAFTFVTVQEGTELTRIEMRIDKQLQRAELKGFESFSKPVDPSASLDDVFGGEPGETGNEPKPVFGKPVRKVRRAL